MLDYKKLINHQNKEIREYRQQISANECEKLLEVVGQNKDGTQWIKGSDTINFIKKQVRNGKKMNYTRFCCDIQLQKEQVNCTRLMVGETD